ncbi:serine--tRNA ligase [Buchnera aphidicola]|uniref:serine--tRNA ligase n=1 Tax=Buchnera aphidicola TaxID=9 RepID=UPI003CE4832C
MLNPYLLRHELHLVAQKLLKKGYILDIKKISSLEDCRKKLQIETENLQFKHNSLSNLLKKSKENTNEQSNLKNILIESSKNVQLLQTRLKNLKDEIYNFSMCIPNIPSDDVPEGDSPIYNKEIKYWGKKRKYNFPVQDHVAIGQKFNQLDLESASKMSGSRFVTMTGEIALLHRALSQFMLDLHTLNHGYTETYVPYLVHPQALYGTGQLPKFTNDLFHITDLDKKKYILIPTGEVPLTNLVYNKIINEHDLPIMLTAHTPCFRSEASSYGRDTKGLIRLHQFDKVELVQIVEPTKSMSALETLTHHAEKVLQLLNLPYRKILLCTGEMGFASIKTYDLEVWFPAEERYREISSCSNMHDFQARRMKARYKKKSEKKNIFVHTLNGSGLAIGRTLAAILENYQDSDGRVEIPKILQKKYMQGLKFIN